MLYFHVFRLTGVFARGISLIFVINILHILKECLKTGCIVHWWDRCYDTLVSTCITNLHEAKLPLNILNGNISPKRLLRVCWQARGHLSWFNHFCYAINLKHWLMTASATVCFVVVFNYGCFWLDKCWLFCFCYLSLGLKTE